MSAGGLSHDVIKRFDSDAWDCKELAILIKDVTNDL